MYRSPAGPPFTPACPSPGILNLEPVATPAGIFTLIFLSFLTAIASDRKLDGVAIGVHSGDHAIYPDCRPTFIHNMEKAIYYGTDGAIRRIHAPFLSLSKSAIVKVGLHQSPLAPYNLTRTCYKDQDTACGKCGSCIERLEAFKEMGVDDPIMYDIPIIPEENNV